MRTRAELMRIVILGGTRFIGHAAALRAHESGHEVVVLHRGLTPSELPFAEDVLVDRNDPAALAKALVRARPDVLIDTRAMTRAEAETSALAAKIVNAPVVVLSSQDVYAQFQLLNGIDGPPAVDLVDEDAPLTIPKPFAMLGPHEGGADYDKKDVEAVFRAFANETSRGVIALRLPGVYGPRDPKRRFAGILDAIARDQRVFPCARGRSLRLTHAHVADVGVAIVLAAERVAKTPGFDVFNVGEHHTPTMRERVGRFARARGREVSFEETDEPLPPELALLGAFANDCVLDVTKIERVLGFSSSHDP